MPEDGVAASLDQAKLLFLFYAQFVRVQLLISSKTDPLIKREE